MLANAGVLPHIPVSDIKRARDFYHDTLGVTISEEGEEYVSLDCDGTEVYIYLHPDPDPSERTLIGWMVDDLDAVVEGLAKAGVETERYEGFGQDERGIAQSPDGPRATWIKDPDGHVISLLEYPE